MSSRAGVVLPAVAVLLLWPAAPIAGAQSAPAEICRVTDARLAELSGLASDGRSWYAVGDGGSSVRAYVLNPATCAVREVRTASVNPYDVEDLALAPDGAVWLADTGDNDRRRENIALHVLPKRGAAELYRLSYPDGPHDAEALLLDKAGVPYIVTKEPLGSAGVYRPAEELSAEHAVPLRRVGTISLRSTNTPGGPVNGAFGSVLVTGGSVSRDGTLVAIRTYTEAYVYRVPNGDLAEAFRSDPLRIPLPNEPQGEAIAWEPDGSLLSASEGNQPVRRITGVADALVATESPDSDDPAPQGDADQAQPPSGQDRSTGQSIVAAAAVAALVVFVLGRLFRRR